MEGSCLLYTSVRKVYPLELVLEETQLRIEEAKEKERLLSWDCTRVYDQDLQKEIEESFSYVYPYEAQALVPSKLTVSEVKRMQEPVEEMCIRDRHYPV